MSSLLRNVRISWISFLRSMPSESDIQIHIFSNFTKVSLFVSYQTYNICNFATTYDGQTVEKVCPTYPPIYRYGASPPSNLQWTQIRDFQTQTRNPGLTFPKPENPGLQKEPGFGNSSHKVSKSANTWRYKIKHVSDFVFSARFELTQK